MRYGGLMFIGRNIQIKRTGTKKQDRRVQTRGKFAI